MAAVGLLSLTSIYNSPMVAAALCHTACLFAAYYGVGSFAVTSYLDQNLILLLAATIC